jgi:membrane-associated phospholipid phosphatase
MFKLHSLKFYSGEWITLAYVLVTTVFLTFNSSKLPDTSFFFEARLMIVIMILSLASISRNRDWRYLKAFRQFLPFIILGYWYSETYDFAGMFLPNQDPFFCRADQKLFGMEPSLAFCKYLPERWFSELMYFGYFSYYIIAVGVPFLFWQKRPKEFSRAIFVILCSFYLYYIIYIILPVGGPQFYYQGDPGKAPSGYFFSQLIHYIQRFGEKPTGAFPSSHVGISTILLLLTFSKFRKTFWFILPIYVILAFSTVYIKAHYMVDVLGGFLSAILFYIISNRLFDSLSDRFCEEPKYTDDY